MFNSPDLAELIERLGKVVGKRPVLTQFPGLVEEVGEYAQELVDGDEERQAEELADVWLGATVLLRAYYPAFDPVAHLESQASRWLDKFRSRPEDRPLYMLIAVTAQNADGEPSEWLCLAGPTPDMLELADGEEPERPEDEYLYLAIVECLTNGDVRERRRWDQKKLWWVQHKENHESS